MIGAVVEGLVGELSGAAETPEARHGAAQALTLFALRGLGVADARARGLVVQAGEVAKLKGDAAAPQCAIRIGTVIVWRMPRVVPPSTNSRRREWP